MHDEILTWIASSLWFGPTPADEGIRRCEAMRAEVRESPEAEAAILRHLAGLHAMRRPLRRSPASCWRRATPPTPTSASRSTRRPPRTRRSSSCSPVIPAAAEASLRAGYRALEEMGDRMFLPTTAAFLARALLEQGHDAEAEHLTELSARLAGRDDLLTQILWRGVRARVLARRDETAEAEELARDAVRLAGDDRFRQPPRGRVRSIFRMCSKPLTEVRIRCRHVGGAAALRVEGQRRRRRVQPPRLKALVKA